MAGTMNLRELEYLVAVADHRHFGDAAAACFVSQPTLSTQLRKLETELGVDLVERSPRRVALTPAGQRIVDRAREVLQGVDDIQALARAAHDPAAGAVRIGVFPTLAPYLLPHVVPAAHARWPRMELLLIEDKTQSLVEKLRAGQLDVALLARPVRADGLEERPLFTEEFVLAVPADHPLAGSKDPVPISALTKESVLLLDEGHCLRDQALSVCQLVGAEERSGFRATSLETLRQMVGAGVGVTLLPRLATRPPVLPAADVCILPLADPVPNREIAAYWRRSDARRDWLPELADALGELPPGSVTPAPRAAA